MPHGTGAARWVPPGFGRAGVVGAGGPTYRRRVLKTALQPRWLTLLAFVVVLCCVFAWLGSWQLGVAQSKGVVQAAREQAARPAQPVDEVLAPQRPFASDLDGRQVTATGRYDATKQVLVPERLQGGVPGWWVVTALQTGTGLLPVVRGWVASPTDPSTSPSAVPTGTVSLRGVLQPDDGAPSEVSTLPEGQLAQVDAADLVNRWGSPIYNGYVLLSAQQATATGPQPQLVPAPTPASPGVAWRNAAYAVQWWVFAGFALLLWWKMVRQEQLDEQARADRAADDEEDRMQDEVALV